LILISGPSAAGKSSLAEPIARELRLPLIEKDVIKEALFDAMGVGDRAWSDRLSTASYAVMFAIARRQLGAVLDANFKRERHAGGILALCPWPIEVFVTADPDEIVRRFQERAPERHPGHLDQDPEALELIREEAERGPLDIGGPLLVVDTTNDVDPDDVLRRLRPLLPEEGNPLPAAN